MLCTVILAVWFSCYTIAAYIYDQWLVKTNRCFPKKFNIDGRCYFGKQNLKI